MERLKSRLRVIFAKKSEDAPEQRLCDRVGINDPFKAFTVDIAVQRIILENRQPPYERFFPSLNAAEQRQALTYLAKERKNY